MKKSLIALAALSAFATAAQAQSSVTVYGTVDVGYGESKFSSNDTSKVARKTSNTGNGDGGLSTSILGFRGTEDLGGGSKANFNLEYDLTDLGTSGRGSYTSTTAGTQTSNQAFGARQTWVGLENTKMGQVRLGRQMTASHGVVAGFSAGYANNTAGAVYSLGAPDVANELGMRPHAVFADRLVTYISPVMGGLQATLQYGKIKHTTDANATTENKFSDIALRYTQGKLALGASLQDSSTTAPGFTTSSATSVHSGLQSAQGSAGINSSTIYNTLYNGSTTITSTGRGEIGYKTTSLGASYDFGVVQPFALYTSRKSEFSTVAVGSAAATPALIGSVKQENTEIGVRVPLGKVTAFASTYDGKMKNGGTEPSDKLSGYQLGGLYAFSKRTTAYAIMGQQKFKSGEVAVDAYNAKVTATSVGVRHTF